MTQSGDYILGVDLGQARDPTALALVERQAIVGSRDLDLRVRWLNELPLGTPYPAVVSYLERLVKSDWLNGRVQLAVDYTGVGRPVVDYLREQPELAELTWAISFTSGKEERQTFMDYTVPKSTIVMSVLVAAQEGRLKADWRMPHGQTLKRQLLAFAMKRTAANNAQFEGEKSHDDMVMALACAVWLSGHVDYAPRASSKGYTPERLMQGNMVSGLNPLGIDLGRARSR